MLILYTQIFMIEKTNIINMLQLIFLSPFLCEVENKLHWKILLNFQYNMAQCTFSLNIIYKIH